MRDTIATMMVNVLMVVVMGISGSGKSTVATGCAHALGWALAEGDDFHPAANVAKMRSGQPLTDDDRWPWLRSVAQWVRSQEQAGQSAIVACSALRRAYREVLRAAAADVRFVELDAAQQTVTARMLARTGHFMPASLVQSQMATLEPLCADEPGIRLATDARTDLEVIDQTLAAIRAWI